MGPILVGLVGCSVAVPSESPGSDRSVAPSGSAVLSSARPSETAAPGATTEPSTPAEDTDVELPVPVCPAPASAVVVPAVTASIGGGPSVIATPGSSQFSTCSTTASSDAVPSEPRVGLTARPGDRVVVRVPADWLILRWEGSDHPLAGDAANVWPAVAVSDPG
ncbi:MAG TPA: hypothetical protein VFJ71_04840, partial [Candidatus Limnocylindrales bacterium]|nr:hypothetical protein [Candidatus Limnocylindrales bacterium]